MLNGINNSSDLQKQQIAQSTGMDKTGLFGRSNPYSKMDKNHFIDQLDISSDAMKLFERDADIKRFTQLALSDPSDVSHNMKVASDIASGSVELSDSDVVNNLFSNQKFLEDILG